MAVRWGLRRRRGKVEEEEPMPVGGRMNSRRCCELVGLGTHSWSRGRRIALGRLSGRTMLGRYHTAEEELGTAVGLYEWCSWR